MLARVPGRETHGCEIDRERLLAIELADQRARLVFIRRRAAAARERVRRDREETREREPARDILDVRIEPAVLVNHDDGGSLRRRLGRMCDIAADGAAGAVEALAAGDELRVVLRDGRRGGVVVLEQRQEQRRGRRAAREPCEPREELAAVHAFVRVFVVELDDAAVHASASGMRSQSSRYTMIPGKATLRIETIT